MPPGDPERSQPSIPVADGGAPPANRAASAEGVADGAVPPASSETEGLRERKKRATRRHLRAGALALVAERGLDGVTVDEIAAAAGVSPRTFFNYFASKEDALVGLDPELVDQLVEDVAARPQSEAPLEAVRTVFLAHAHLIEDNREQWRLQIQVVDRNPAALRAYIGGSAELDRRLAAAIGARTGLDPARHPYPQLLAAVSSTTRRLAVRQAVDQGRPYAAVLGELFDVLAGGMRPDPSDSVEDV